MVEKRVTSKSRLLYILCNENSRFLMNEIEQLLLPTVTNTFRTQWLQLSHLK
jgi:heptaprenylglyceryl phosphate synthase